jgi:hypothetical protein
MVEHCLDRLSLGAAARQGNSKRQHRGKDTPNETYSQITYFSGPIYCMMNIIPICLEKELQLRGSRKR